MRPASGMKVAIILALFALANARLENFGPELKHRKYTAPSLAEQKPIYSSSSFSDPKEIALEFVKEHLTNSEFKVKNSYKSEHNGVTHVYLRQVINDLEVMNGDINVNVDENGRVISYGDSFYKGNEPSKENGINSESTSSDSESDVDKLSKFRVKIDVTKIVFNPKSSKSKRDSYSSLFNNPDKSVISPEEAIFSLAKHINQDIPHPEKIDYTESVSLDGDPVLFVSGVPFTVSDVKVRQVYVQTDEGKLQLCWDLEAEMENNWYHGQVNAHDGKVVQLIDWVADAAYNVFPIGTNDPSEGSRELVIDPADKIASPLGWHSQSRTKNFTVTIGNNVYAHENLAGSWEWEDNYRPDGGRYLEFDFPLNLEKAPKTYVDSSVTNLFFWNNIVHDLFYRYGFNEVAGNFQQNNFGKGGKDKDAVIANAQDGSGYNNANFATPPDGQHGKMRMYVWDVVNPWRDGDLEAGIIIHEYSHGISTRLTGGPANSGCLGWGEAGGMGEGWGDFFATILRMKPHYDRDTTEFGMGDWANGGEGIRRFKYSTSKKTNPETFSWMDKPGYWGVHPKGAVWAEMLYEVYWNLVDKHGFTSSWFPPTNEEESSSWYTKPKRRPKQDPKIPRRIPKHGNTLTLQLVVDAMKLQPCRPQFTDARDAIIQADEILTGGENKCEIWQGFAKRGLGVGAKVVGGSPWGGGVRKESYKAPKECNE
ncbi:11685_t:CDS:2 [Ambispora leptoticha]|uniref:Extracellular metalloproteinase n=1 Tax=Ambispora leptoticha TaxID=144679 RepID=A0A9N9CFT4_9GLOM|nr:11685_t:CDS:2 [Ambispora leptoticha]